MELNLLKPVQTGAAIGTDGDDKTQTTVTCMLCRKANFQGLKSQGVLLACLLYGVVVISVRKPCVVLLLNVRHIWQRTLNIVTESNPPASWGLNGRYFSYNIK